MADKNKLSRRNAPRASNKEQYKRPKLNTLPPMTPTDEASKQATPYEIADMFRPPVNRAMRTLDRSFFRRKVPLSVARIFKASDISNVRKELVKSRDILLWPRISPIREAKDEDGKVWKAMLLRENLKLDGRFVAWIR